jgi:hypothetical protein
MGFDHCLESLPQRCKKQKGSRSKAFRDEAVMIYREGLITQEMGSFCFSLEVEK